MSSTTRDGILAAAMVALAEHIAEHHLPAPLYIDFPDDEEAIFMRVRLNGIGKQNAWLDTVEVLDETNEPRPAGYVATQWSVRLPETMTRVVLTGARPQGLALVGTEVSA